ncbi:MAG TPA: hypothetical protein VMT89_08665, partial [Candidatus Acidoferrales bacterium]|nr:hypothetical protein [Candidatus Acidoferrales bacterium]
QQALRLDIDPAHGESFSTSRFHRIDRSDASNLDAETSISDLPGSYRADLCDARKNPIGWLSVRVLPYEGLPRTYEADVPESLDGPLTAAAFAMVDSEIAAIIKRNTWPEDRIPEGLAP